MRYLALHWKQCYLLVFYIITNEIFLVVYDFTINHFNIKLGVLTLCMKTVHLTDPQARQQMEHKARYQQAGCMYETITRWAVQKCRATLSQIFQKTSKLDFLAKKNNCYLVSIQACIRRCTESNLHTFKKSRIALDND